MSDVASAELRPVQLRRPAFAGPSVDAITHAEAAEILDVFVTTVAKFLRDGRLEHTYPGHKRRLSRARVEQLAAARWRPRDHGPGGYWVTGTEAAELLGCAKTSVYRMSRDGRLPEPHWSSGRMLFRRAQVEVIANAVASERRVVLAEYRLAASRDVGWSVADMAGLPVRSGSSRRAHLVQRQTATQDRPTKAMAVPGDHSVVSHAISTS